MSSPPLGRAARVALAAVPLAVLLALGVLLGLKAWVRGAVLRALEAASERTGREVSAREVRVSLGARLAVELRGLRVGPAPGATPPTPLLEVQRLRVALALGPLLRSRGQRFELDQVLLEGAAVDLVRHADGTLSTEDLARQAPPPRADRPRPEGVLRSLRVSDLQLTATLEPAASYRARVDLSLDGDPREPGSVLRVRNAAFSGPFGAFRAQGEVRGPSAPSRVELTVEAEALDLSGPLPAAPGPRESAPEARAPELPPAWLAQLHAELALRVGSLRAGSVSLSRLAASLHLESSVLEARASSFEAFGGAVDLAGTRVALAPATAPSLSLRARAHGLALSALAPGARGRPSGTLSVGVELEGPALSRDPRRAFQGSVSFELRALRVHPTMSSRLSAEHPLLARVAEHLRERQGPRPPLELGVLSGALLLQHGALRLRDPLRMENELGRFELTGTISAAGALDLRGSLRLHPAALARGTRGLLAPAQDVPVEVRLTGDATEPHLELLEPARTVESLREALPPPGTLRERVREQVQQRLRR